MDDKIIVSIGLPVYNGEKYIEEAINSVTSQTFLDFELIISDNGSTDKTEDICRIYAKKDQRINYIRQPKNLGIHFNSNFVLQKAKGQYYTWLAHDDALEKNFLEQTIKYLDNNKNCFIVTSDFESIDESGKTIRIEKLENIRDNIPWEVRAEEFFKYPMKNEYFCFYGLFRTEKTKIIFQKTPQPKMLAGSELPFLARFAASGEIASIPLILRKYRRHSQSSYVQEVNDLKKENFIRRYFINLLNLYRLRLDQMRVLIKSNFPLSLKFSIILSVHYGYFKSFAGKLARFPKKLLSKIQK